MIDYSILNSSIEHYESKGYNRIESPWTVSKYVDNITKPEDRPNLQLKHNDKCLVASGEQSFLYLYLKGFLPKGRFQTITPCFRYESFDDLHTKYFMKNELIITDKVTPNDLNFILEDALDFFKKYLPQHKLRCVPTSDDGLSYDIEFSGIELGSYGIRKCKHCEWIYGTGVAEPRLSTIIQQYKNGFIK